jgi:hypothetical protein
MAVFGQCHFGSAWVNGASQLKLAGAGTAGGARPAIVKGLGRVATHWTIVKITSVAAPGTRPEAATQILSELNVLSRWLIEPPGRTQRYI